MRRVLVAVLVPFLLVACGSTTKPYLTVKPAKPHNANFSACVSLDCGPRALTLQWGGIRIANQTGYYVFVNGSQVADVTTNTYLFTGIDCGSTNVFGVEAHDAGGGHTNLVTTTYTAPACGAVPALLSEPVATGTVATDSVVSTTTGSWTNSPTSYSYQWQDCPTDGSACSDIAGATSQTYTVQSGDTTGNVLRAQVRARTATGATAVGSSTMIPFGDVFSGSSIDSTIWNVTNRKGDSTQGPEAECYVPAQVAVTGGQLVETAVKQTVNPCPYGQGQATTTASYASGAVQAKTFNMKYGTVRARIQFAPGQGAWGAWWGYDARLCQWPNNLDTCPGLSREEIDLAEIYPSDGSQVQFDLYGNGPNQTTAVGSSSGPFASVSPFAGFHIYELDWTPSSLVFKVDATTVATYTTSLPPYPWFPIFNLALGGISGSITDGDLPTSNKLDWVYITTNSPMNTVAPTLSGTLVHGNTITLSHGTWGSGQACGSGLTCTYLWNRCDPSATGSGYCSQIAGATNDTYALQSGDTGKYIEGVVTATNADGGSSSAASSLSAAVG